MIIVSACLAGIPCNYNGEATPDERIIALIKDGLAFPVCPEVLGGLTISRSRTRIVEGDGHIILERKSGLVTADGRDVTKQFLKGAELTLKVLRLLGIDTVVFKQDSPSCGCGRTLGGLLEPVRIKGDGVTTAFLKKDGISVFPEESLADDKFFEGLRIKHSKDKKEPVLISMCGLGIPCQYRARSFLRKGFVAKLKEKYALCPLCPEQFGGMPTPRVACCLKRGRIIGKDGEDYTQPYRLGASIVLDFAKMAGIKRAYLKKGSPSCGVGGITRKMLEGAGITVHLL